MIDPAKLKRHANLVDRMASALGIDLEEAMLHARGPSIDDLGDAVLACTQCSNPAHCESLLARQPSGLGHAPAYCRNLDLLQRLKPE